MGSDQDEKAASLQPRHWWQRLWARPVERERQRLRRAIRALPEREHQVFRLHRDDDLDFATIGERLGISVPEVEAALAHALVLLMRAMDSEDAGNP